MSVNNLLLWEKWRPKTIDDMVILPRIRKNFEKDLDKNYIFYGGFGTGKTTLSRILIGKYTKDKPYLELNSSLYTSIDVLRNEIEDFCKTIPIMESDCSYKYVFLDEFERVSAQFQDAFKAFIEKYSKNNVRFIITTNNLSKISDGIKSRISQINFDCQSFEEEKFVKIGIYNRVKKIILPSENKNVDKDTLIKIINKKFPDLRSILIDLQDYLETGSLNDGFSNLQNGVNLKLYNMIYDEKIDYVDIYNFLMTEFGTDKIDIMMSLLSKQFIDWSISNNKNINKLFECNYIISEYYPKLEKSIDPIVLGMSVIGEFRKILLH
jgi:DNA polymerase III delta prime subunit